MAVPQALNCPSCGAPTGSEDVQCRFCGSQLATVACPQCFAMVSVRAKHCGQCGHALDLREEGSASRDCPDCRKRLHRTVHAGIALEQCEHCGGVWLEREAFDGLAKDREVQASLLGFLPPGKPGTVPLGAIHYRPCPDCGRFMNRLNYAHISGVILDLCKTHGVWFEKDELRQVVAFIQSGGLDEARERRIRELKEAGHPRAPELPQVPLALAEGQGSAFSGGTVLTELVWGLLDLFQ